MDRDLVRAAALLEEYRAAAEQSGEKSDRLRVLSLGAYLARTAGDLDGAREAIVASKELAAELGKRDTVAAMALNLAVHAFETGDYRAGLEQSLEAFELFSELEQETGMAVALLNCGWNALCLDDLAPAEGFFVRGLGVAGQVGAVPRIANGAEGLGATLIAAAEHEGGVEFLGAASSLRETMGVGLEDDMEEAIHAQSVEGARTALGEAVFASAWARGGAMTAEEVVDRAMKGLRERA